MARRTFFSFHYKEDVTKAAIVRSSWVTQDRKAAGFFDAAEWEEVKKKQDPDIEKWIDKQLDGTSVTVVLIGQKTAGRKWINYEIKASHIKGNGILGIYIHNLRAIGAYKTTKGINPLWGFQKAGRVINYPVYDWVSDNGYKNMGDWIEKAALAAGK